jgi:hypothetical protein
VTVVGLNAGHGGLEDLPPATARAWGAKLYRWPLHARIDPLPTIRACRAAGIEPLPVLVRESFEDAGRVVKTLHSWRDEIGDELNMLQVCNEPDGTTAGEGASWVMSQAELNIWLGEARYRFPRPRFTLIGPGLISGQPGWLQGVNVGLLDALAPHPYAKEPNTLALDRLLDGYRWYGRPLFVTEYDSRVPGMGAYLATYPGVQAALVFCGHRYAGFGLLDHPAALADFLATTGGTMAPSYSWWIGDGLLASIKAAGDTPIGGERRELVHCPTREALHVYVPEQDRVYRIPWSQALPASTLAENLAMVGLSPADPHAAEVREAQQARVAGRETARPSMGVPDAARRDARP